MIDLSPYTLSHILAAAQAAVERYINGLADELSEGIWE